MSHKPVGHQLAILTQRRQHVAAAEKTCWTIENCTAAVRRAIAQGQPAGPPARLLLQEAGNLLIQLAHIGKADEFLSWLRRQAA